MPITITVTCDTTADLDRLLQKVNLDGNTMTRTRKAGRPSATTTTGDAEPKRRGRKPGSTNAKTPSPATPGTPGRKPGRPPGSTSANKSAAATATPGKRGRKPGPTAKTIAKAPKTPKAPKVPGSGPGRKPSTLQPVIQDAVTAVAGKGQPFRTKDVIAMVMKKNPGLNESSVTTGVSKTLSESKYRSEEVKVPAGRPYKLYHP